MPLFKILHPNSETKILVWHITESIAELSINISLSEQSSKRLQSMHSQLHQRAFLAVRQLLQLEQLADFDLHYSPTGKPFLKSIQHISISHSHQFAVVALAMQPVGVDIELQKEKIMNIASKFSSEILNQNNKQNYIRNLTRIWSAKEAVFKIENQKGISFKNHIFVGDCEPHSSQFQSTLRFKDQINIFHHNRYEFENYVLVLATKNK